MKSQFAIAIAGSLMSFAVVVGKEPCVDEDDPQFGICLLKNLSDEAFTGITELEGAKAICDNVDVLEDCLDSIDCVPVGMRTAEDITMICSSDCKVMMCDEPSTCGELEGLFSTYCGAGCEDHPMVKEAYDYLKCKFDLTPSDDSYATTKATLSLFPALLVLSAVAGQL